ncbi:MAG TPA: class II aldolase/adducin family protein [Acidimicrobiia bacterium]|nr:class II aldolase/adducin family protein [Acidimicrobiia bacterium]
MRVPQPGPGIGRALTVQQQLACALRILAPEWQENLSGHLTWANDDGSMWVNPWGVWWQEVRASQIIRVDADGNVVEGDLDVTPVVAMHTELHRARPDATLIVHNHPYYATLLSIMGETPRIVHQNSCIFDGELAFVDEYTFTEGVDAASSLADAVGKASGVLLAHHGALVTAPTVEELCYKATTFERMCRFTYDILAAGREPVEFPASERPGMQAVMKGSPLQAYWDGALRDLLARSPEVLD